VKAMEIQNAHIIHEQPNVEPNGINNFDKLQINKNKKEFEEVNPQVDLTYIVNVLFSKNVPYKNKNPLRFENRKV
jgi:hypothetical protein